MRNFNNKYRRITNINRREKHTQQRISFSVLWSKSHFDYYYFAFWIHLRLWCRERNKIIQILPVSRDERIWYILLLKYRHKQSCWKNWCLFVQLNYIWIFFSQSVSQSDRHWVLSLCVKFCYGCPFNIFIGIKLW